jgi:hypothetical protein
MKRAAASFDRALKHMQLVEEEYRLKGATQAETVHELAVVTVANQQLIEKFIAERM